MRLGVLAGAESWYVRDLQRAAGHTHVVESLSFRQLSAVLTRGTREEQGLADAASATARMTERWSAGAIGLSPYDAILVRAMPPGSLEQIVFRMNVLARLEAAGTPVVNAPRSLEIAVDKYLALSRLAASGYRVPETWVGQTTPEAMEAFEVLGRDVVLKPVFGSEGRGLVRLTDAELAWRAFRSVEQCDGVLYLQRFVSHEGYDLRLLVLGEEVLGIERRHSGDWRTNVRQGAIPAPYSVTPSMEKLALGAAGVVGTVMAGVDVLPGKDGELYVLEVNAVPGWEALARTLEVDVAARVLDLVAGLRLGS